MELAPRLRLMNWLVSQGLTGLPENDLIRGFCERCCAEGLGLSRGMVFIDTLHPIFEGRGFRWNDTQTNESDAFEYGSTNEGEAAQAWQNSVFYHMLESGVEEMPIDLADGASHRYGFARDLAEKGHKHVVAYTHRFGEAGTMGQMDCVYSYFVTRRDEGFGAQGLAALRDLVPVLGLAIKSAAQADIAKTLGRVYLGRDAAEQVLRGRIARGVTERINAVLWFSDLRGSTAISESIEPGEIIPFLNDYAQASIDAIHDAGGEVLKLMGDGVLAMFTQENMHDNMAVAKRAALRAEHRFRRNMKALTTRRTAENRTVTSAHVGLHVGEVFYGNIGSDDRLDFTVVGPAVNEVSRIASMCRSVDRELLMSSAFRAGLDAAGRNYLVSTGRYALRGIGRAQDLYTLDPDIAADEVVAGKYERYLALTPTFQPGVRLDSHQCVRPGSRLKSAAKAGARRNLYKHILLPTDGSELSKAAMRHGIALAKAIGARVSALVVSTPLTSLVVDPTAASAALEQYKVLVATQTAKYLDSIRNEAAEAGVACSALCVEHDKPYEAIVDTAKNNGCDLVVMASHGLRGVSAILGSETLKVLTHSAVPILVYR